MTCPVPPPDSLLYSLPDRGDARAKRSRATFLRAGMDSESHRPSRPCAPRRLQNPKQTGQRGLQTARRNSRHAGRVGHPAHCAPRIRPDRLLWTEVAPKSDNSRTDHVGKRGER